MSNWPELELAEHLAPVEAPAELWNRVAPGAAAERPRRARFTPVAAVPIAAVVTLILTGALWFMARGESSRAVYRQVPVTARSESCLLCHVTL
jgi:hypothetical protein